MATVIMASLAHAPHRLSQRTRLSLSLIVLLASLWPGAAAAHDPSAWGGLYRSRDGGATWFLANPGRFVTGALAVTISAADPNHLLLATDSGLLRSRNGGRDWEAEAPTLLLGPVFAVAFDADGQRVLAATSSAVHRTEDGLTWREAMLPPGANPARWLTPGTVAGRVYLAGWRGLYRSDDWGSSWQPSAEGLPEGPITALVVSARSPETIWTVAAGEPWVSIDGGRTWDRRDNGLPTGRLETLMPDQHHPTTLWAAGNDRLYRSTDDGGSWRPIGNPVPDAETNIRGIAADVAGVALTLATHRGLYRSVDAGVSWELMTDSVPVHLEMLPLAPDPTDRATLYAGFSVTPYDLLWSRAARGGTALDRLDAVNLAGGVAFLLLLTIGSVWALRRLMRYDRLAHATPLTADPDTPAVSLDAMERSPS
jgi:photosystem II stability/assembly factor-like uncharacterized protein